MAVLKNFDHQLIKTLRQLEVENHCLVVATSGGLDSMALLAGAIRILPAVKCNVVCAHIHHGWVAGKQGQYRDRAWQFVSEFCAKNKVPYYSNLLAIKPKFRFLTVPEKTLKSEGELREFRYRCLEKLRREVELKYEQKTLIVTAHTANDLLETQLMRLIRGAGLEGIEGMTGRTGHLCRPLLNVDRDELQSYAREMSLRYLNDPSNESLDPFRNWMRHKWLPELEAKRPGSLLSLSRSLSHLTEAKNSEALELDGIVQNDSINHLSFLELSRQQKSQVLASYLKRLGVKNYGTSHVHEILKRLDTPKKEHTFTILKHDWTVNAEQITARPL